MPDPILHRYTGRTAASPDADTETDNVEDQGGWGLVRGVRDRAVSLELRKKDGTVLAIPYALIEQSLYSPSDGITLRALGRDIRVKGRGLNDASAIRPLSLFTALSRHRASWIAEPSRLSMAEGVNPSVVESIVW